ncbi:MAG: type II secretion system protein [Phycisphaerae bacterium]
MAGAFTLIELLVVIAIIALLMSILMPALGQAKRIARETICATNIRNLVTAFHMYADSHDGRLPQMSHNPEVDVNEHQVVYWISTYYRDLMIENYNVQRKMFYSPTNPAWNRDDFWEPENDSEGWSTVIGYFCWGGDPRLQHDLKNWMFDPPNTGKPLFPVNLYDDSYYDFLWTDMNRQLGDGNWITTWDADRWGANHLYDRLWPTGSHVGLITGGVIWTEPEDLEHRFTHRGARFFW